MPKGEYRHMLMGFARWLCLMPTAAAVAIIAVAVWENYTEVGNLV